MNNKRSNRCAIRIIQECYCSVYEPNDNNKQWFLNSINKQFKKRIVNFNEGVFRDWVEGLVKDSYQQNLKELDLFIRLEKNIPFQNSKLPDWLPAGLFTILGALIGGSLSYWSATKACFVFLFLFTL